MTQGEPLLGERLMAARQLLARNGFSHWQVVTSFGRRERRTARRALPGISIE